MPLASMEEQWFSLMERAGGDIRDFSIEDTRMMMDWTILNSGKTNIGLSKIEILKNDVVFA